MSNKKLITSEKLVSKHLKITESQLNFINETSPQLHMSASCLMRLALDRYIGSLKP